MQAMFEDTIEVKRVELESLHKKIEGLEKSQSSLKETLNDLSGRYATSLASHLMVNECPPEVSTLKQKLAEVHAEKESVENEAREGMTQLTETAHRLLRRIYVLEGQLGTRDKEKRKNVESSESEEDGNEEDAGTKDATSNRELMKQKKLAYIEHGKSLSQEYALPKEGKEEIFFYIKRYHMLKANIEADKKRLLTTEPEFRRLTLARKSQFPKSILNNATMKLQCLKCKGVWRSPAVSRCMRNKCWYGVQADQLCKCVKPGSSVIKAMLRRENKAKARQKRMANLLVKRNRWRARGLELLSADEISEEESSSGDTHSDSEEDSEREDHAHAPGASASSTSSNAPKATKLSASHKGKGAVRNRGAQSKPESRTESGSESESEGGEEEEEEVGFVARRKPVFAVNAHASRASQRGSGAGAGAGAGSSAGIGAGVGAGATSTGEAGARPGLG